MKKILALCLTAIMVFSVFAMPAMAATITVPADTMVSGEFTNLTALPDGWTIAGTKDAVYKFDAKGIAPAAKSANGGYVQLYKNDTFDAGKANYTFSVSFSHYDGTQYFHFGAETTADAAKRGVSDTGYTLTGTHYNTATDGTYKFKGTYALYKEGNKIADLTDAGAVWAYQGVREFKIYVTDEDITVSGAVTENIIADADPIKSGYVGAYMINNTNADLTLVNLASMKLTTEEYSYDVTVNETNTGAYVVLDTEYTESHIGELWYSQSLAGLSADTVPASISVPTNTSYSTNYVTLESFKSRTLSFGTQSVDDGASFIAEAKYSATNESNGVHFNFLGYDIHSGKGHGGIKLKQGSTTIVEKDTTAWSTWTNGSVRTVKAIFDKDTSTMDVYFDTTLMFEDVEIASPTYTGTLSIKNDYSGDTHVYYVKLYSHDYEDTSSYVDQTRSNFLFERVFTSEDATIADLRAQGYSITATGIDEEGLYTTEGQVTVEYTKYPFKGAYTIETKATGGYKNPEVITFNKTASGDYYCLSTAGGSWSLYKYQNSTKTVLVDNTTTEADDNALFYKNPRTYKISLVPATDESGTLDIKVVLNGTEVISVTDTAPITEKGTFKVTTGHNKPSHLNYIKVYPNGTAPTYSASFVVDGADATVYTKGNTLLKFPVAMVGNEPAIVAALYEDNAMTDVKIIDIDALNVGVAELFDTSASTATKASIKVFVWNSIEGMVPVLDPFVLE